MQSATLAFRKRPAGFSTSLTKTGTRAECQSLATIVSLEFSCPPGTKGRASMAARAARQKSANRAWLSA
jgi:hypothetical protein